MLLQSVKGSSKQPLRSIQEPDSPAVSVVPMKQSRLSTLQLQRAIKVSIHKHVPHIHGTRQERRKKEKSMPSGIIVGVSVPRSSPRWSEADVDTHYLVMQAAEAMSTEQLKQKLMEVHNAFNSHVSSPCYCCLGSMQKCAIAASNSRLRSGVAQGHGDMTCCCKPILCLTSLCMSSIGDCSRDGHSRLSAPSS